MEKLRTEHKELKTTYTYESRFQRRETISNAKGKTITQEFDSNGNLEKRIYPETKVIKLEEGAEKVHQLAEEWRYNESGQVVRAYDPAGNVTKRFYYPEENPAGAEDRKNISDNQNEKGGFLARVERTASLDQLPEEFQQNFGGEQTLSFDLKYDERRNVTHRWDGRDDLTRFEYDSLDRLEHVTRRDGSVVSVEYDENGNPDKKTQRFDRYEFDENDEELKKTTAEVTTKIDYTSLDNVERRTFISGDKTISTLFERDEMENIYCKTLPENNQIKYRFDERNLLVENTWAPETEDETSFQYTWSRDGLRTSRTNGKGETIRYHYDNQRRYRGFTNEGGTTKAQQYDPVGKI